MRSASRYQESEASCQLEQPGTLAEVGAFRHQEACCSLQGRGILQGASEANSESWPLVLMTTMFSQVSWTPWTKLLSCWYVLTWTIHCPDLYYIKKKKKGKSEAMPVLVNSFSISSLLVGYVSQCPFLLFMQLGSGRRRNLSWGHANLCSEAQITTSDSIWSKSQLAVNSLLWEFVWSVCIMFITFSTASISSTWLFLSWKKKEHGMLLVAVPHY